MQFRIGIKLADLIEEGERIYTGKPSPGCESLIIELL